MGGLSANKPVLPLITGPMMPGSHRGERIGACTDCRNNWAAFRAGQMDVEEISAINEELAPTVCDFYPLRDQSHSFANKRSNRAVHAALWEQLVPWPVLRLLLV